MADKKYQVHNVDGSLDLIEADQYYFSDGLLYFSKLEDTKWVDIAIYKDWRSVKSVMVKANFQDY